LSRLAVWWLRLGVWPERITPGRPEQNGAHEQFHRVLKRETACPPAANRDAQQRHFAAFIREYNDERPHEALHQVPPATRYTPSPRPLPQCVPPLEYPEAWEVRRVTSGGEIKWGGRRLFLTHVLTGEDVAFEPTDDGVWLVRFAALPLAVFHERGWVLQRPETASPINRLLSMCPDKSVNHVSDSASWELGVVSEGARTIVSEHRLSAFRRSLRLSVSVPLD
jgi:putative transposase